MCELFSKQRVYCQLCVVTKKDLLAKTKELENENIILKNRLAKLERMIFGSKSEKFISPDNQLSLSFEQEQTSITADLEQETITYKRKKKKHPGRHTLPEHLLRKQVIIEPAEDVSGLKCIGEEVTEILCRVPGTTFVLQYMRKKYEKSTGDGILIGELPSRALPKSIAHESLLADMLVKKYVDHLPLYRQAQQYKREGVILASSTMSDWVSKVCKLLEPLYAELIKEIKQRDYLQADESPIQVLDKTKKGKSHRGYQWVYLTGDQSLVLFDYQKGRGRDGPRKILEKFQGYLQTDGYAVYESYGKKPGVTLIGCMAHARRYFEQALESDKQRASHVLAQLQLVYHIERQIKEQQYGWGKTKQTRQQLAQPALESLYQYLIKAQKEVLPKSPIGKAIQYSLVRWDKLTHYLGHGGLHIDNNKIENMIRPLALGRKNYLFAGSHQGAKNAAIIYSLVGSCKLNDLNPYEYLFAVLDKLPDYSVNKLNDLLPCNLRFEKE